MRFSESALVATNAEDSFEYVTDQSTIADWNEHVQSTEVVGGGTVRVGSVLRQHRRRGSKEFDLTFEVVEHDRPRRHVVKGTVFGLDTVMAFDFSEQPSGTLITQTGDVRGTGLRGLLAPLVAREMRKSVVAGLDELRTRLGGS